MLSWLPPEIWQYGGPGALLAAVFLMVMRGALVPSRFLTDVIKERDDWKAMAFKTYRQNQELLHGVSHVTDVLDSIPVQGKSKPPFEEGG